MANFFEGVGKMIAAPFDNAWQMGKGVVEGTGHLLSGQFDKAWDDVKDVPGKVNDNWTAGLKPVIGDNWVSNNPLEAAAGVAGIVGLGAGASSLASGSGFGGFGTEGAFGNYFKPSSISKPGLGSEGVGWQGGAQLDLGVPETYEAAKSAGMGEKGFDWELLGRTLQSIKPNQEAPVQSSGRVGGGRFNYNSKQYENPLLTREYEALYNAPLYNKLV